MLNKIRYMLFGILIYSCIRSIIQDIIGLDGLINYICGVNSKVNTIDSNTSKECIGIITDMCIFNDGLLITIDSGIEVYVRFNKMCLKQGYSFEMVIGQRLYYLDVLYMELTGNRKDKHG